MDNQQILNEILDAALKSNSWRWRDTVNALRGREILKVENVRRCEEPPYEGVLFADVTVKRDDGTIVTISRKFGGFSYENSSYEIYVGKK